MRTTGYSGSVCKPASYPIKDLIFLGTRQFIQCFIVQYLTKNKIEMLDQFQFDTLSAQCI